MADGTLEDFEKALLDAFAGDIAGDGGAVGLPADFVDLVNVDDAELRPLHVVIGILKETKNDGLHVFADVAGLGEGGGVSDGKRNVENPGEGAGQEGLLKILEGTVCHVPPQGGRKHPQQEHIAINTQNILFICGGGFVGLDEIVRKRLGGRSLGFGSGPGSAPMIEEGPSLLRHTEPEDLLKFGMIPEFIGRLPVLTHLHPLTAEELIAVLTETKNCLTKQYAKLFGMEGVKLNFTRDALKCLADKAMKKGTGARALRSLLEGMMLDLMYEIPSRDDVEEVLINRPVVEGQRTPIIKRKESRKAA